jgi:hypothetical protein
VAFRIRHHPQERIADRHGAYRPALPGFGAVEETEDYRTVTVSITVCRFAVVEKPLVV